MLKTNKLQNLLEKYREHCTKPTVVHNDPRVEKIAQAMLDDFCDLFSQIAFDEFISQSSETKVCWDGEKIKLSHVKNND